VHATPGRYVVQVSNGTVTDRSDAAIGIFSHIVGATAPGAPTITASSIGGGMVQVSVRASSITGGAARALITTVCRSTGFATRMVYTLNGGATVTGLQPGIAYSCSSSVTNGAGFTSPAAAWRTVLA